MSYVKLGFVSVESKVIITGSEAFQNGSFQKHGCEGYKSSGNALISNSDPF